MASGLSESGVVPALSKPMNLLLDPYRFVYPTFCLWEACSVCERLDLR